MSRLIAPILLLTFSSLTVVPLWAQFPTVDNETSQMKGTARVRVIFPNNTPAPAKLNVQLWQSGGMMVRMSSTDSGGTTEFEQLNAGYYVIRVSGEGIEPAQSETFPMEDGRDYQMITITVKPAASRDSSAEMSASAYVAVVDLNVPKKAAKEYKKANEEMAAQNWEKAAERLKKAVQIYPQYSSAYNDLGICYGRLKQRENEREALMKAISVNDHCMPALINLAHMQMQDHRLVNATATLEKALKADPSSTDALGLLAQVDLMQQQYELAIRAAHKAHELPHHYAIVHYTAATALVREHRLPEAIAELRLFLDEEPEGPRADAVRKVLAGMQNQGKSAPGAPTIAKTQ